MFTRMGQTDGRTTACEFMCFSIAALVSYTGIKTKDAESNKVQFVNTLGYYATVHVISTTLHRQGGKGQLPIR